MNGIDHIISKTSIVNRMDREFEKTIHTFYTMHAEGAIDESELDERVSKVMNIYLSACKQISELAVSTTKTLEEMRGGK
jgi:hypothetical protein